MLHSKDYSISKLILFVLSYTMKKPVGVSLPLKTVPYMYMYLHESPSEKHPKQGFQGIDKIHP